ncbi:MAG: hypothetical protein DRH08_13565, partial [Deltaproteobacteria bacterium]
GGRLGGRQGHGGGNETNHEKKEGGEMERGDSRTKMADSECRHAKPPDRSVDNADTDNRSTDEKKMLARI